MSCRPVSGPKGGPVTPVRRSTRPRPDQDPEGNRSTGASSCKPFPHKTIGTPGPNLSPDGECRRTGSPCPSPAGRQTVHPSLYGRCRVARSTGGTPVVTVSTSSTTTPSRLSLRSTREEVRSQRNRHRPYSCRGRRVRQRPRRPHSRSKHLVVGGPRTTSRTPQPDAAGAVETSQERIKAGG